jgi:HSP20 family protein
MDRWLGGFLGNFPSEFDFGFSAGRAYPALNVWEEGDQWVAEAEVPGLRMEEITVMVQGDELTIQGERRNTASPQGTFHRQERGVGEFSRVIRLPTEVNPDKVQAVLRNGVLTLRLPKSEAALPKRVEVRVS